MCFGVALLFGWRFTQIRVFRGVELFEFALAVSVIRVSPALPTLLSSTLIVALSPFGVRATFVGHIGPLCFGGLSI